jgi:hypothetical protein
MARKTDYVSDVQRHTRSIWDALNALQALQVEWNALDYGVTLGLQNGVEALAVGAVVFDTVNALRLVLNGGHATNMAKLL